MSINSATFLMHLHFEHELRGRHGQVARNQVVTRGMVRSSLAVADRSPTDRAETTAVDKGFREWPAERIQLPLVVAARGSLRLSPERLLVFWQTCGVMPRSRSAPTKSALS